MVNSVSSAFFSLFHSISQRGRGGGWGEGKKINNKILVQNSFLPDSIAQMKHFWKKYQQLAW